MGFYCI